MLLDLETLQSDSNHIKSVKIYPSYHGRHKRRQS